MKLLEALVKRGHSWDQTDPILWTLSGKHEPADETRPLPPAERPIALREG